MGNTISQLRVSGYMLYVVIIYLNGIFVNYI